MLDEEFTDDLIFVENLINAANLLMKYSKFQMFHFAVKAPPETVYKWMKILRIVEFVRDEIVQLRMVSSKPEVQHILPQVS